MNCLLITENTVFPPKSAPGAYLILKLEGVALIGGRRLLESRD